MLFSPSLPYALGILAAAWIGWLSVVSRAAPRNASGLRRSLDHLVVRVPVHLVLIAATTWVALALGMDLETDLRCQFAGVCDYLTPRSVRWASVADVAALGVILAVEVRGGRERRQRALHGYHHWE